MVRFPKALYISHNLVISMSFINGPSDQNTYTRVWKYTTKISSFLLIQYNIHQSPSRYFLQHFECFKYHCNIGQYTEILYIQNYLLAHAHTIIQRGNKSMHLLWA